MIPASLLLILVAVTLLALGLTSGSSNLLISSIVASLLAAIALVIGARRTAGARRAAGPTTAAGPDIDEPDIDRPDYARPDYARPDYAAAPEFVAEPEFAAAVADEQARRDLHDPMDDEVFAADSPSPGQRDTVQFEPVRDAPRGDLSVDDPRSPDLDRDESPNAEPEPDYDRAASVINAARSENPGADAWRRNPDAEPSSPAASPSAAPSSAGSSSAGPASAASGPAASGASASGPAASAPAASSGEVDEFDEPDADDPDDEPLPQSVRPADAVRVARMDAEVLVVDGRPRYHLPDCTHLVGRLTEPIPVNEAVELGFSPCGLCRPVDRLAAAAARR